MSAARPHTPARVAGAGELRCDASGPAEANVRGQPWTGQGLLKPRAEEEEAERGEGTAEISLERRFGGGALAASRG